MPRAGRGGVALYGCRQRGSLVLFSAEPSGFEAGNHASSLALVSGKSERQAARTVVAGYHDEQLRHLVDHVAAAIDRYRAGELDAFEMDRVTFQYSRAAKELWKFCNLLDPEAAAGLIREQPPVDWWERGAPTER
jgi:hypothetical protein